MSAGLLRLVVDTRQRYRDGFAPDELVEAVGGHGVTAISNRTSSACRRMMRRNL